MPLPVHVLRTAQAFTKLLTQEGVPHLIVGGAAILLQGLSERDTRDLDVNLGAFNFKKRFLNVTLQRHGFTVRQALAPNRFSVTSPESCPGARDATHIDIAFRPEYVRGAEGFTSECHGVTGVADPRLLLLDKIRCSAERAPSNAGKFLNDLRDVRNCAEIIAASTYESNVPPVFPQHHLDLLTADVWDKFWDKLSTYPVPADKIEILREYLRQCHLYLPVR